MADSGWPARFAQGHLDRYDDTIQYSEYFPPGIAPEELLQAQAPAHEQLIANRNDTSYLRGEHEENEEASEDDESGDVTDDAATDQHQKRSYSKREYWSRAEEKALMTALKDVGSPDWQEILRRYGPGGTVNESLKKRTAAQLGNKATYMKRKMIKHGERTPAALREVNPKDTPEPRGGRKRKRTAMVDNEDIDTDSNDGDGISVKKAPRRAGRPATQRPGRMSNQRADHRVRSAERIDLTANEDESEDEDKYVKQESKRVKSSDTSTAGSTTATSMTRPNGDEEREMVELQLRQLQAKRTAATLEDQEISLQIKLMEMRRRS